MIIYASIMVGIALGLLSLINAKLEDLKAINREILKQLRDKEKDDGKESL